ncbi:MAG: toprim domain-containing protein [Metamycoplasmataceae bacterium]
MDSREINNLSLFFQKFTGIGSKQSKRMAHQLLKFSDDEFEEFLFLMHELKNNIKNCTICKNYTNNEICLICSSESREKKLMIVESIEDISRYEEWNFFKGKYYVFPIIFNSKFERTRDLDISKLVEYAKEFDEVIIALSANIEGALTANFIDENLSKSTKVSHLANGVPVGASIEYIDKLTFKHAFQNRKESQ